MSTLSGNGDLFVRHAKALTRTRRIELRREYRNHFTFHEELTGPLGDFDAVFMRKDPPFDVAYLHANRYWTSPRMTAPLSE